VPLPGGAVIVKPGYDARASSTAALLNARPTASGDASWTVHRSRVDAPSSVSESGGGTGPSAQVTDDAVNRGSSCARTQAAFASISGPVSTSSTELR
jgi:hypothetical protein